MAKDDLGQAKGKVSFAANAFSGGQRTGIAVEPIGDLDQFLKLYVTTKQIQKLIDFKTNYIVKDGYFISSRDEEGKAKAEEFFNTLPILDIIRSWSKFSMVYGAGYLEYTGNNLVPRDSRAIVPYIDEEGNGEILQYVQELGNNESEYPEFDPEDMLVLLNNPIDHIRGLSELLGIEEITNLDYQAMEDISATLNRSAYNRTIYKVGTHERPVSLESDTFINTRDAIEGLRPGEDLVVNSDVEAKPLDNARVGMDYKAYMDLINERMCMFLGVPFDVFFGSGSGDTITQRRLLFEEAEIMPRRRQLEDLINRELIPRIVTVNPEEPVEFKFGDINIEMAFIQSKRDLVELQTGSKTADEHRIEKGRDPLGDAAVPGNTNQQIPISSRDETATSTIGGNLTGQRDSPEQ